MLGTQVEDLYFSFKDYNIVMSFVGITFPILFGI